MFQKSNLKGLLVKYVTHPISLDCFYTNMVAIPCMLLAKSSVISLGYSLSSVHCKNTTTRCLL